MGYPAVSVLLAVALVLTATLPGPTMGQAEATGGPAEANTNMTLQGNQCSPLQRRLDLLNKQMTEKDNDIKRHLNGLSEADTQLHARLNGLSEADTQLHARLNGLSQPDNQLNARQDAVDARLNRIDSRFDALETMMSDMKEYLRQRLDSMEVKAELALASTKDTENVVCPEIQPSRTPHLPKDCQEAYTMGNTTSGIYTISPEPNTTIDVLCEQELDGGGWLVFQQRKDGSVDFYKDWNSYKSGFGELTSEFWLGNTNIHLLTKHHDQKLKVELTSPEGEVKYADYARFSVADEAQKYRLTVGGYSGGKPPGDGLTYHNGAPFSTKDSDSCSGMSCAISWHGAWWYKNGHESNLNGKYGATGNSGVEWWLWKNDVSMKGTRMMLKKKP